MLMERAQEIKTNEYVKECKTDDAEDLKVCIQTWAAEVGSWNCRHVWKEYLNHKGADMSRDYYSKSVQLDLPTELVLRGGVRLAFILNSVWS
jgi:hypothetical protein